MTLGESNYEDLAKKIVDEIIKQGLVRAESVYEPQSPCLVTWSANVYEQLAAVIKRELHKAEPRTMTPVDKNGVPLEVGQEIRIKIRNTVYPGVLLDIFPEKTIPSKNACLVVVEIDGEPECVGSYRIEVV